MAQYVDTSMLMNASPDMSDSWPVEYPTPTPSVSTASAEPEQPPKKKRKAWGQPVPEINPILPPRKRAKTDAEKEQRKNERILRNRRAADKSRQRQKAAVADLERRQVDIEAENAQLKALLTQYQSQFGKLPGCDFNPSLSLTTQSPLTPQSLNDVKNEPNSHDHSDLYSHASATPELSAGTPSPSVFHDSPPLAPTLHLGEAALSTGPTNVSGMTHYPAEIMCDLQCQPDTLGCQLRSLQPRTPLSNILTLIHCLIIWQTSSTQMLSKMYQAFQILAEKLSTNSTQLESLILNNFHLIHILISMPSTSTRPAVFRMKLLSRLLACNPKLAHLFETAADRALQQKMNDEGWTEDAGGRWAWASLMTIKWTIRHLENEHRKLRAQWRADGGVLNARSQHQRKPSGVDWDAVMSTAQLWEGLEKDEPCTTTSDNNNIMRDNSYSSASISTTEVH